MPLQSAEHYYLITDRIPEIEKHWPVLEDPGSYGYFREEGGGLMVGLFEPLCAPWKVEGVPEDFSFGEITPDWDRMGPYVEKAMKRVPRSLEVGVRKFFCGPESFTPDLQPCVGESPEVKNFSWRPASTRLASSPGAVSGAFSPTGSRRGGPTSTSPASTSIASIPTRRIPNIAARGRWNRWGWSINAIIPPAR